MSYTVLTKRSVRVIYSPEVKEHEYCPLQLRAAIAVNPVYNKDMMYNDS